MLKKRVMMSIIIILSLVYATGCSKSSKPDIVNSTGTTTIQYTEQDVINSTIPHDLQNILEKTTLSQNELMSIASYVDYTPSGIRLVKKDNTFSNGWLEFYITDCSIVTHLDEINGSSDGFLYESYLGLNAENEWVEYSTPPFINSNGSFADGWSLVLVDINLTNHNAAKITNKPGSYDDPYLFRSDTLLWLADKSYLELNNHRAINIDYFSECNRYPEHQCCFRVTPGESIAFKIGFLIDPELQIQSSISNYELCNTTGNVDSVFIALK